MSTGTYGQTCRMSGHRALPPSPHRLPRRRAPGAGTSSFLPDLVAAGVSVAVPARAHAPWTAHIPIVAHSDADERRIRTHFRETVAALMRGGTSQQDARCTADEQTRSAMAAGTLPNVAVGNCGCVLGAPHGSVLDCRSGMR
jgi:hypothetical protein